MKKIVCIIGTRPQLIKHSVLLKALQNFFVVETLHVLQHYQYELNDLLKQELYDNEVLHELQIDNTLPPARRLGNMIVGIASFLEVQKPDAVLVYGDTDTTLAGALAASKMILNLIHVEAGERSFNNSMPEEANRIVCDAMAHILFCSSYKSMKNLQQQKNGSKIIYSGDVMKDLLLKTCTELNEPLLTEDYIFCTIHRNYNKQNADKLKELLQALTMLTCKVIFPVHPATYQTIQQLGISLVDGCYNNIVFMSPVSYKRSIHYQMFAKAIVTDSGGIQKEAYWLKVPCFTYRKETEWMETLEGGWNKLVYDRIGELHRLINEPLSKYNPDLYGNGQASSLIAKSLSQFIK